MNQFSVELATSILHLEMQKEQILKENEMNSRLCACRLRILHNYINVCQLFFIRYTARIIKFLEDQNIRKTLITGDLKTWYGVEMYDKLYSKRCVSGKMVLLFKLLQDRIDKEFFRTFDVKFKQLIKTYDEYEREEFVAEFQKMYSEVLDWMEMHILGILSLKIDCSKISDKITEDFDHYVQRVESRNSKDCNSVTCASCVYYHGDDCPSKDMFCHDEEIHLYVTEETMANDNWLLDYFKLIEKYHQNIHDIDLVIDYILFDEDNPLTYGPGNVYRVQELAKLCKSTKIINYGHVNFGEYLPAVRQYCVIE